MSERERVSERERESERERDLKAEGEGGGGRRESGRFKIRSERSEYYR